MAVVVEVDTPRCDQVAGHTYTKQRRISHGGQTFAAEVINHVKMRKPPSSHRATTNQAFIAGDVTRLRYLALPLLASFKCCNSIVNLMSASQFGVAFV